MQDLKITISTPIKLYSNSKFIISIVDNSIQLDRMNIERIRQTFVENDIEGGVLRLYSNTTNWHLDVEIL